MPKAMYRGRQATPQEMARMGPPEPLPEASGMVKIRAVLRLSEGCAACERVLRGLDRMPMPDGGGVLIAHIDKVKACYAVHAHAEATGHDKLGWFQRHIEPDPGEILAELSTAGWPVEALKAIAFAFAGIEGGKL